MIPTAQQVFILCGRDRKMADALIADLLRQLAEGGTTILADGISPKGHDGFIVVQAERGIPEAVGAWLVSHPEIKECVIYDVPEAMQTDEEGEGTRASPGYEPERDSFPPPVLPQGYKLHSQPRPLVSSRDTYWTAWAWNSEAGTGLLLYDEGGKVVAFFTAEEATTLLYTLLERASGDLLPRCQPQYLSQHAPGVTFLRAHLWALQVEVMRRAVEHGEARRRRKDGEKAQKPNEEDQR